MKNMKISLKLLSGFLIVALLTIVVGVTGIYGLTTMDAAANSMYSQKAKPLGDLAQALEYFQRLRVQVRNAIIYTGNVDQLKTVENDMNDRITQFEAAMTNYEPTIVTEKGKQLFTEIMAQYKIFKPGILHVLEDAKTGTSADALLEEMAATTDAANVIANDLSSLTQARMEVMSSASDANSKLGNMLLIIIIAVIAVAVVVSVILALYISGLISKPMEILTAFMIKAGSTGDISLSKEDVENIGSLAQVKDEIGQCIGACAKFINRLDYISKSLETVAGGDLTTEVDLLSSNDTMGLSLKGMVDNLNNMFVDINTASVQVSSGSQQIADGSQLLAQGSMEQSASVEELSASVAEIAGKTEDNAEKAKQAANLSDTIKGNAEKGSSQMEQMLQAVKEINEASSSIGKVIKVIDDIAFQTNILALNAAVEAARAGQHGKGFAVVADEVRNLAAKSAVAAKDTSSLIENSIEKANLGSRIATETSVSLLEIVEGIKKSAEIVEQIARLSNEQSEAIKEINSGIDQVAQVVQQNSATAEESAAASEEMSGQSNILKELISQFKLKGASGGYSAAPLGARASAGSYKKPVVTAEKSSFALSGDKY